MPMHMVASAYLRPWVSVIAVPTMRAPLIPVGWPSAIAPPFGLTRSSSSSIPNNRRQASACRERLVHFDDVHVGDRRPDGRAVSWWRGSAPGPSCSRATFSAVTPIASVWPLRSIHGLTNRQPSVADAIPAPIGYACSALGAARIGRGDHPPVVAVSRV